MRVLKYLNRRANQYVCNREEIARICGSGKSFREKHKRLNFFAKKHQLNLYNHILLLGLFQYITKNKK